MAPYHHQVNTHHRKKRASKVKKFSAAILAVFTLFGLAVGFDYMLSNAKSKNTVVSVESSATVQSATINVFQSPYFRFQANDNWREVSDELNLASAEGSEQYLYRYFDDAFIEHELWIGVNIPDDFVLPRHNVPTRVQPVQIEPNGTLKRLGPISDSCIEVLDEDNPFLEPHVLVQKDIEYFCNPNTNDFTVALGVQGASSQLLMPRAEGDGEVALTIIYRDITATPDGRELRSIIGAFKSK